MGEWTDARKAFEHKALDRRMTKRNNKNYEDFWSFFQAGVNFGKAIEVPPMKPLLADGPRACDWSEDWPHENGKYMCICADCGQEFVGYKRRTQCKTCFQKQQAAKYPDIPTLYHWVEEASDLWAKHFRNIDRDLYLAQFIHQKLIKWQKQQ